MKKYSNGIFLDSSFIISTQIINDPFYDRSEELVGIFSDQNRLLLLSPLVMDEFWYVIRGMLQVFFPLLTKTGQERRLLMLTEKLFSLKGLNLVTAVFSEKDLQDTLSIMSKYELRPRDALIVKSMELLGVKDIATFDSDFDRVKGLNVIK